MQCAATKLHIAQNDRRTALSARYGGSPLLTAQKSNAFLGLSTYTPVCNKRAHSNSVLTEALISQPTKHLQTQDQ